MIKKDKSKFKNILLQWILLNILGNQTFQKKAMLIMVDSYELDFMKGNVILISKNWWDVQFFEVC